MALKSFKQDTRDVSCLLICSPAHGASCYTGFIVQSKSKSYFLEHRSVINSHIKPEELVLEEVSPISRLL